MSQKESGKKFALLIGVSQFNSDKLTELNAPLTDVSRLGNVLANKKIGNFDVTSLPNPSSIDARRAISELFRNKTAADTILLYFSGHGLIDADNDLYLATQDTQLEAPDITAVSASFVRERMNKCRSGSMIIVLDCCHSGAFTNFPKSQNSLQADIQSKFSGKGRVIITATDEIQYAWEGSEIVSLKKEFASLFTDQLIDGLETGAADSDNDGKITVVEWYEYAYDNILSSGTDMRPQMWMSVEGVIELAHNPFPKSANKQSLSQEPVGENSLRSTSFDEMAKRYGIKYNSLIVDCHIGDDGAAKIVRKVSLTSYAVLRNLDTFLLSRNIPDTAPIVVSTGAHSVKLVDRNYEDGTQYAVLEFLPTLMRGKAASFEVNETVPALSYRVNLTNKKIAEHNNPSIGSEDDLFGWSITRPTKRLELNVYFPENCAPDDHYVKVYYASASGRPLHRVNSAEAQNVIGPTITSISNSNTVVLSINVDYPPVGLVYALFWVPTPVTERVYNKVHKNTEEEVRFSAFIPAPTYSNSSEIEPQQFEALVADSVDAIRLENAMARQSKGPDPITWMSFAMGVTVASLPALLQVMQNWLIARKEQSIQLKISSDSMEVTLPREANPEEIEAIAAKLIELHRNFMESNSDSSESDNV